MLETSKFNNFELNKQDIYIVVLSPRQVAYWEISQRPEKPTITSPSSPWLTQINQFHQYHLFKSKRTLWRSIVTLWAHVAVSNLAAKPWRPTYSDHLPPVGTCRVFAISTTGQNMSNPARFHSVGISVGNQIKLWKPVLQLADVRHAGKQILQTGASGLNWIKVSRLTHVKLWWFCLSLSQMVDSSQELQYDLHTNWIRSSSYFSVLQCIRRIVPFLSHFNNQFSTFKTPGHPGHHPRYLHPQMKSKSHLKIQPFLSTCMVGF